MSGGQENGISQEIVLTGVPMGKGDSVQVRYRVSYHIGGQGHEEQGSVPSLGIT